MRQVGDRVPDVTFRVRRDGNWVDVTTKDLFDGKTVAVFALPGAFTPTCSSTHLPGYMAHADELAAEGVDAIYCLSVNDSFVMNKWAQDQKLETVTVIPDGSGEFSRKIGMLVAKDNLGFGMRSWRYAAIVKDGVIEAWFEEPGLADNHGEDPYGVSSPETVLEYLAEYAKGVAAE